MQKKIPQRQCMGCRERKVNRNRSVILSIFLRITKPTPVSITSPSRMLS